MNTFRQFGEWGIRSMGKAQNVRRDENVKNAVDMEKERKLLWHWSQKKGIRRKNEYKKLERKLFWQTLALVAIAFFGIWAFYILVWFGRLADTIVALIQFFMGMNYEAAVLFYHDVFRRNYDAIVIAASGICFFIIFRFFLRRLFIKYFYEIDKSIDALVERDGRGIEMCREMAPMERKLNTVLETLEQQFADIQSAEQKKDELVMYLAHDIRTPLTSVIGYLNLMEEMPDLSPEQRQKFLQVTLEKANRLETLVHEFFDITRYNRQEIVLSKVKIDLYYMLSQMAEEAYPMLVENKMRIEIKAKEDCFVYGSGDKLARVFLNLLKNAITYGKEGSVITIEVKEQNKEEKQGNAAVIRFSNEGQELSKEDCARIFDKFYRMDAARQTNNDGAGLGLAIARELVEMHGGTIHAESSAGITVFEVVIPGIS